MINGLKLDLSLAEFLPRGLSDHSPVVIHLGIASDRIFKPFQLFKHLMDSELFMPIVAQAWSTPVRGDKWYILTSKLKFVKQAVKSMNKDVGILHSKVISALNELSNYQSGLSNVPSYEERIQEGSLSQAL